MQCIHRNADHCCQIVLRAMPMNHLMHCLPNIYQSNGRVELQNKEKNAHHSANAVQALRISAFFFQRVKKVSERERQSNAEQCNNKNNQHSLLASSLSHIVSTSTKMLAVNSSQRGARMVFFPLLFSNISFIFLNFLLLAIFYFFLFVLNFPVL